MSEHQLNKQKQHKAIPVIEEQGRALMQAVPDLVFLLGLDGRYIDIFSAADEDLFLPREQLIGRTVLEVLPPPVGEDCMAAIGALSSPKDVSSFSYELQIGGSPRWFEGSGACGRIESRRGTDGYQYARYRWGRSYTADKKCKPGNSCNCPFDA